MVLQSDCVHAYVTKDKHCSGLLYKTYFPMALEYLFEKHISADISLI